eukprot:1328508-Amorphochlora_amoeboformis.AAC.1
MISSLRYPNELSLKCVTGSTLACAASRVADHTPSMPTILPSKRPAELSGTSRKLVNKKRRLRAQESIVPSRWMKGTVEKYKNGHPDGESAGKNLHRLRRVSKMAASVPMPKEVLLAGDR